MLYADDNPYRFADGYRDRTTGLYKLGARYYDPSVGRFTQLDPTGQDPHYTYARNNPINYTDPDGAYTRGDLAKTVIGTGGAILIGAAVCATTAGLGCLAAGIIGGAVAGGVGAGVGSAIDGDGARTTRRKVADGAIDGAVAGFIGGVLGRVLKRRS